MFSSTCIVLGSGSPRRQELMREAGYDFTVIRPDDSAEECGVCSNDGPVKMVAELAFLKASNVVQKIISGKALCSEEASKQVLVIGADTVAECGGIILGKPKNEDHAHSMLLQMSGQLHRVYTGVCVWPLEENEKQPQSFLPELLLNHRDPQKNETLLQPVVRVEESVLKMDRLTDQMLDTYLESGAWEGKAGAFGFQDGLDWVHLVTGSESNVVGLPLDLLKELLSNFAAKK